MTGSKPAIRTASTLPSTGSKSPPCVRGAVGDRALRVAFLTPAWPLDVATNGIVTYVDSIAAGLRRQGHTICIRSAYTDAAKSEPDMYPVERDELSVLARIRAALAYRINP